MSQGYLFAVISMLANAGSQQFLSRAFREAGGNYKGIGDLPRILLGFVTDVRILSGGFLAISCLVFWSLALAQLPITRALPVMALIFVVSPLLAALFLGEEIRAINIVGYLLIVGGVVLSSVR